MTIVNFCTHDLKQKQQYQGQIAILMSNFLFLIKSAIMQILLVSMATFPIACLTSLVVLEVLYTGLNLLHYFKNKHLKTFLLLIPKIVQSLLILTVEICLLSTHAQQKNWKFPLSAASQDTIIKAIVISTFIEYGLLAINIIVIIKTTIQDRNRKKTDKEYKEFQEQKNQFIQYKKKDIHEGFGNEVDIKDVAKGLEPTVVLTETISDANTGDNFVKLEKPEKTETNETNEPQTDLKADPVSEVQPMVRKPRVRNPYLNEADVDNYDNSRQGMIDLSQMQANS
jgi:uncharacterized membrane protein